MKTFPSPSKGAPTAISTHEQFHMIYNKRDFFFSPCQELRTNLEITSISILVEISDATDCHPEHGVVRPVQTDGPGLIIPVAKGVQVDIHSSTDLRLTVKEIWSSNNEICPTGYRNKCGDLRSSLAYSQKIMWIIIFLSPILVQVCCGH